MKLVPDGLIYKLTHRKTYDPPEYGQELRPKRVGAMISKQKHGHRLVLILFARLVSLRRNIHLGRQINYGTTCE